MSKSSNQFITVAMDGGAAVGKSSTSRGLAERLNLMHVDTGSHYRTLTYALMANGVSAEDELDASLETLSLETHLDGRAARLSVNGIVPEDADIRSPKVNAAVSHFAARPALRQALFDYQRSQAEIAQSKGYAGLIMEGRDIGSVIFPDADFRFFLEADEATRTIRREKEGLSDSIADRDKLDKSRKAAPLVCPEGATRVDTATHTLEEVIQIIIDHIQSQ